MFVCTWVGDVVTELSVDEPGAVFVTAGEGVVDDLKACGEEEGQ